MEGTSLAEGILNGGNAYTFMYAAGYKISVCRVPGRMRPQIGQGRCADTFSITLPGCKRAQAERLSMNAGRTGMLQGVVDAFFSGHRLGRWQ